jgi:LysM repeat protein
MRQWISLVLLGLLLVQILMQVGSVHAAERSQSHVIHVVAWGETLFSIAQRYDTSVDAIYAANHITDPARIYAGQRLVIPTSSFSSDALEASTAAEATHVVQTGENLYRIALRYGTTAGALAELNGIYNPDQVFAGQTLMIPGSPTASTLAYQPRHAATTHTVRPGETLAAIAHHYSVAVWTLVQANNVTNPALIIPGQVLAIPQVSSLASTSTSTPAATGGGRRIVVDLSEQHLYAYVGETLVHSFVVSTGVGGGTRTGTFRVLDKYPNAYASTWDLQMPYWMGIYWAGGLENGIHALPILSNGQRLWEGYLGRPASFGCVILGALEARTLYEWAAIGTPVIIQY